MRKRHQRGEIFPINQFNNTTSKGTYVDPQSITSPTTRKLRESESVGSVVNNYFFGSTNVEIIKQKPDSQVTLKERLKKYWKILAFIMLGVAIGIYTFAKAEKELKLKSIKLSILGNEIVFELD